MSSTLSAAFLLLFLIFLVAHFFIHPPFLLVGLSSSSSWSPHESFSWQFLEMCQFILISLDTYNSLNTFTSFLHLIAVNKNEIWHRNSMFWYVWWGERISEWLSWFWWSIIYQCAGSWVKLHTEGPLCMYTYVCAVHSRGWMGNCTWSSLYLYNWCTMSSVNL